MGIFERIFEILSMMFGGTSYSKIVISGDTVTGKITKFEVREDGTAISALTDKSGANILADCLNSQTLFEGELYTNPKGFGTITLSAGSIKVDGSTLVIS